MGRTEEIRARCEEKRVYHQNGAWEPESQMHADCEDLLARVERLEAVEKAARKLKPYWVEITRGLCLLLAEDQTIPVVEIQKCIGVWVEAIEALEERDGE